tara:strand:- start:4200 stop:4529 length:330 start_codon:yes stop_codon:yes gene_type:complete
MSNITTFEGCIDGKFSNISTCTKVEEAGHFAHRVEAQTFADRMNGSRPDMSFYILQLPEGTPGTEYVLSSTRETYTEDDGPFVIIAIIDRQVWNGELQPRRAEYFYGVA